MKVERCGWATSDPLYLKYHDEEWGVPKHEDRDLFELLILEGAQAGLSWITILKKRENYRRAFDNFEAEKIAKYGEREIKELLSNPGIVRNRLKVISTLENARRFLDVQETHGSFARYIWNFIGKKPIENSWTSLKKIPSKTPESDEMSRDLKSKGFRFVGSTICYSFMQATGMVNDHVTSCFRHDEIAKRNE